MRPASHLFNQLPKNYGWGTLFSVPLPSPSNSSLHPLPPPSRQFNLKYNPCGQSRLREIFIKQDNLIHGR